MLDVKEICSISNEFCEMSPSKINPLVPSTTIIRQHGALLELGFGLATKTEVMNVEKNKRVVVILQT